jgi:hypothetical protein
VSVKEHSTRHLEGRRRRGRHGGRGGGGEGRRSQD